MLGQWFIQILNVCTSTAADAFSTKCHSFSTVVSGNNSVVKKPLIRRFIIVRDLENVQANVAVEYFLYQVTPKQYEQHTVVYYPVET